VLAGVQQLFVAAGELVAQQVNRLQQQQNRMQKPNHDAQPARVHRKVRGRQLWVMVYSSCLSLQENWLQSRSTVCAWHNNAAAEKGGRYE
jgi:hypothetical protein